ncbi:serine hydrolase domain-containing protein [Streptomyces collinus]|uniref:serine hydrolase domain-containing protein n=1 Tax=Streptomyces collinus TaxID=42684 RepID=UPI003680E2BE
MAAKTTSAERQEMKSINSTAVTLALQDAMKAGGAPGGIALIVDEVGRIHRFAMGVADIRTGRAPHVGDKSRIGSFTKVYVATVILQLEAEGRLVIDDRVDKWLPGVVSTNAPITVRQLLQHTSGLPDFVAHRSMALSDLGAEYTPSKLLALMKNDSPHFSPGAAWRYSNTNYLLAGMLIKKITGNDWHREVQLRILEPLGLSNTSTPGTMTTIPGPHLRGYAASGSKSRQLIDVTTLSPTMADSAGEMISNPHDTSRFLRALLGGRLLPSKQLTEMKDAVDAPELRGGYGLGLMRTDLSCGISVFGHGGLIHGYNTWGASTGSGGRVLAASVNTMIQPQAASTDAFVKLMDAAFCQLK